MIKITTSELKEILLQYIQKEILININGVIETNITINELAFIINSYKIELSDEIGSQAELQIEINMINKILYNKKKTRIKIFLDNDQVIEIDM